MLVPDVMLGFDAVHVACPKQKLTDPLLDRSCISFMSCLAQIPYDVS